MVFLPLAEIVSRRVAGVGIPGAGPFVQHLTLWVAFLGAALAARDDKLLALATATFLPERARERARIIAAGVAATVAIILAVAAYELVVLEREFGTIIAAGVPVWVAQLVLAVGFALVALRLVWRASEQWTGRALASLGLVAGLVLAFWPELLEGRPVWPLLVLVIGAAALGAPIFAVLGGIAVVLFMRDGVTTTAMLIETYALTTSPTLPAIPLFTLAGFLLAEGNASRRLLQVFRAFFGWMPGGTALVCALVCAFFTVFTGGSGVTILALGGLLFPALLREGYRDRFSLGLITASGSLGLLFPPALPLILYAIVARIPIEDLFLGGLLPGMLLVGLIGAWGVREGLVTGAGRSPFVAREAAAAAWEAKWELLLPFVVLGAIFSGLATTVEAAAVTALYAFLVQWLIQGELSFRDSLWRVLTECVTLIGGVLIILGVAVGFMNYLVTAQVPAAMLEWVQFYIESPLAFLLVLNLFLLAVGCTMDIFSAIVVVVPLIVPLGMAYDIHPVHLGIIFVANLELGYLTPPVGLNLFLASYRFKRPLLEVWRASLPPLLILAAGVLLITYVPWLTTGILQWLGR